MPLSGDRRLWVFRGLLSGYVIYILTHAVADFLFGGLPGSAFLGATSAGIALAVILFLSLWSLLVMVPFAIGALILTYRYRPDLWEIIAEVPSGTVEVLMSGWWGPVTDVSPAAAWTVTGLVALIAAMVLCRWAAGRFHHWIPLWGGLGVIMIQWLFYHRAAPEYALLFIPAAVAMAAASPSFPAPGSRPVVYALIVTCISLLVANTFPAPGVWDWGRAGEIITDLVPVLGDLRGEGPGDFHVSRAGWGDERASLGGPVTTSELPMMRITVDGDVLPSVIYLRGTASRTYDGTTWEDEETRGPFAPPGDSSIDYYYLTQTITVVGVSSSTVFGAWQILSVEGIPDLTMGSDNTLHAGSILDRNHEYKVVSRVPVVNEAQIRDMGHGPGLPTGMTPYLELPPDLPQRVRSLARDIAGELDSPYEKALRLEEYLRTYAYTLDAQAPPQDQDFVDFFLFESQEGYCTYYSSALAVMLRAVGIPSRWIQGFRLEIPYDDPMDEIRIGLPVTVTATADRAHAWVEAFIPGYGWILMEPTAAYSGPSRTGALPLPVPDLEDPTPPATRPLAGEYGRSLAVMALILVAVGAISLAVVVRLRGSTISGSAREVVLATYARTSRLLLHSGWPGDPGLTPREYVGTISGPAQGPFSDLTALYQEAAYSPRSPRPEEAQRARDLERVIGAAIKHEKGLARYLLACFR